MKIQSITFAQQSALHSQNRSRVSFRGESLKAYDAVAGQLCSHIESAKEQLTRHIAQLAEKGDYQGVINGKKTLIDMIR